MKKMINLRNALHTFLLTSLWSAPLYAQTTNEKIAAPPTPAATQVKLADTVQVRGYFDMYYQISPQAHQAQPAPANGPHVVEGRYFDRHHQQMTLNMAEISVQKEMNQVKLKADFAFGEMVDQLSGGGSQSVAGANAVNTAANEPTRHVTQAIVSYQPSQRLTLSVGKFYTPVGFEVTKAKDNWQYSRSFLYNYAIPFWHQGVYATYAALPEKLNLNLYLVNAWDGRISQDTNKSGSFIAGVNWLGTEKLAVNYYLYSGVETNASDLRQVHELNALYTFSDHFAIGVDGVLGEQKLTTGDEGRYNVWAVYVKGQLNEVSWLSARYETFDDSDAGVAISGGLAGAGIQQKINSATLTYAHDLSAEAQVRLELRQDMSDTDTYFKDKDGSPISHQETGALAVLYAF